MHESLGRVFRGQRRTIEVDVEALLIPVVVHLIVPRRRLFELVPPGRQVVRRRRAGRKHVRENPPTFLANPDRIEHGHVELALVHQSPVVLVAGTDAHELVVDDEHLGVDANTLVARFRLVEAPGLDRVEGAQLEHHVAIGEVGTE